MYKGGAVVWKEDKEPFLFSMDREVKIMPFRGYNEMLRATPGYICIFGKSDLLIQNSCNTNGSNYANLGGSFELPDDMSLEDGKKYMAAEVYFKVAEIEIFKVTKQ
jgi:hypothetical protein